MLKVDRKSQLLMQFVDHALELASVYQKKSSEWQLLNRYVFANDSSTKDGLKQVKESSCTLSTFLGDTEKLSVATCTGEA